MYVIRREVILAIFSDYLKAKMKKAHTVFLKNN